MLANPDFLHVCRETQFLRESHGLVSTIAKYGRSLGDGTGPDFKCILGIELLLGELAGGKRLEIRHTASSLLPGARLAVQDLGDGVLFHEHHGKPERLGNLLDRCEPRVPLAGLERLDHLEIEPQHHGKIRLREPVELSQQSVAGASLNAPDSIAAFRSSRRFGSAASSLSIRAMPKYSPYKGQMSIIYGPYKDHR